MKISTTERTWTRRSALQMHAVRRGQAGGDYFVDDLPVFSDGKLKKAMCGSKVVRSKSSTRGDFPRRIAFAH